VFEAKIKEQQEEVFGLNNDIQGVQTQLRLEKQQREQLDAELQGLGQTNQETRQELTDLKSIEEAQIKENDNLKAKVEVLEKDRTE
jgi:peptidoglycan hydrolase CwlO-like protein